MPHHARSKAINPLLGVYFGIFIASLFGIVVLLLIFEQLGVLESRLRALITFGSILTYLAIGAAAFTTKPIDYFLSGRRVPSFFAGLVMAATALGGTGLVAISGALFIAGLDAFCVPLGIIAGFVATVALIAPFFRKFGAETVPAYLGMRFDSATVRIVAAVASAAPLVLLLIAEIRIAVLAASWLLEASELLLTGTIVAALVLTTAPGGQRSLTWSGSAQAMTVLIAVLVPATIIAIMETSLPLGQLSHGPVLRAIGRAEIAQGVPTAVVAPFIFDFPGTAPQSITGRYATPFGSIGPVAFVVAVLTTMAGVACSPVLLARSASTVSVYETRKAMGWAVLLAGVVIITLSTFAVFYRDHLMNQIAGATTQALPSGLRALVDLGFLQLDPSATRLTALNVSFRRDGVLLGLPVLMGFPSALVFLVAAGVLAAALATAGSTLGQLGFILAEDVLSGSPTEPRSHPRRILLARLSIVAVAIAAALAVLVSRRDPFDLVMWSLALTASALFPVMLLSVWWKRLSAVGAVAGLGCGFVACAGTIILAAAEAIPLSPALAALIGMPVSFAAALIVTLAMPARERHLLEMVRDLRIPGGEPVFDRVVRLARQKRLQKR